jgi:hypothetical protein
MTIKWEWRIVDPCLGRENFLGFSQAESGVLEFCFSSFRPRNPTFFDSLAQALKESRSSRAGNRAHCIAAAILPPQTHTEDINASSAFTMTRLFLENSKKAEQSFPFRAIAIYSYLLGMLLSRAPLFFSDAIQPLSHGHIDCTNVTTAE